MSNPEEYDVVVGGGGPAGATSALCLTRAGHRVLLADGAHTATFKIGEVLPPAARPLLRDLGLWERFVEEDHLPCYGNLSAWGSSLLHCTDFLFDPNGHGWHLDRPRFDRFLRTAARTAGADVREATVIRHHMREQDSVWRLGLTGDQGRSEVRCRWLIDATGRRCTIARSLGARRQVGDALISLFARLSPHPQAPRRDHDARTLIEAAPDGWWYTALIPSGRRVVAYLTDADLAHLAPMTPSRFLVLLDQTQHVRACLAAHGYILGTPPRGAPAHSGWLDPPLDDGWLAVGDAALSFDPLSAQGILTALYTGMAASRALHAHLAGDTDALAGYRARLTEIDTTYQRNRTIFYELERRWPHHPFWQRRTGTTGVHAVAVHAGLLLRSVSRPPRRRW